MTNETRWADGKKQPNQTIQMRDEKKPDTRHMETGTPPFLFFPTVLARKESRNLSVVGVLVVGDADEVLLGGAHGHPSGEEARCEGLVVGAGCTGTREGLLSDDGTCALGVDVPHTRCVAEVGVSGSDGRAVLGEDGTGEGVLGSRVDLLTDLWPEVGLRVVVDVDGQDWTEDLVDHGHRARSVGLDDGWLDEETDRVVTLASSQDLSTLLLGGVDEAHDLLVRVLGNDGSHEVLELLDWALADRVDRLDELVLESVIPQRSGNVHSREGRALLSLVLEGSADRLEDGLLEVGRRVDEVEVLSTSLTDDSGVAGVVVNVVDDLLPQGSEDEGATSEVESSELSVLNAGLDNLDGRSRDELDDTGRDTGLGQDLVNDVVGVGSHGRRLPDNNVSDEGWGTTQVTSNGGEVEGADSQDETLERPVLEPVPNTLGVVLGLLVVEVRDNGHAESEEVADFGSGVDLSLPDVLSLTDHGGGH